MTRVAVLSGAELALWVARATGISAHISSARPHNVCRLGDPNERRNGKPVVRERFNPHEDWSQGGPLIEKYRIELIYEFPDENDKYEPWTAYCDGGKSYNRYGGSTSLIAAMRALVASAYGDEVQELLA